MIGILVEVKVVRGYQVDTHKAIKFYGSPTLAGIMVVLVENDFF